MRSRTATGLMLLAGTALAGCGGGKAPAAPSGTLTAASRLAILHQVVSAALGGAPLHPPAARSDDGPLAGLSCEKACDDTACVVTCPIDERLSCPHGGAATNRGTIQGTLDPDETGGALLDARQTYRACRPSLELTVDGDPDTTASGTARFRHGHLGDGQTVRISGAVRYASSDGSGRCEVDVSVTFAPDLHGSAHGTACAQAVHVAF